MRNFVIKVFSGEDRDQDDLGAPTVKSNTVKSNIALIESICRVICRFFMCQLFDGELRVLSVRVSHVCIGTLL